jgi:hypothetical protein
MFRKLRFPMIANSILDRLVTRMTWIGPSSRGDAAEHL